MKQIAWIGWIACVWASTVTAEPGMEVRTKPAGVIVHATWTEVANHDPIEFWIISAGSGKAYEALAITDVRPEAIATVVRAMEMPVGQPIDHRAMRFWPKGERVNLRFEWEHDGQAYTADAHELILDTTTGKTLPDTGLVFTGSIPVERGGMMVTAADVNDIRSIASTYNEPTSLMDVPWQAAQGVVYGQYKPNPQYPRPAGGEVRIVFEPQRAGQPPRVRDLRMTIAYRDRVVAYTVNEREVGDEPITMTARTDAGLKQMQATLREGDRDPFVEVVYDDGVLLSDVVAASRRVIAMEGFSGLRIDPPPPGQLHPRAFTPDPKWADPQGRVFQGWELHVTTTADGVELLLVDTEDYRDPDSGQWSIKRTEHGAVTPDRVAALLAERDGDRPRDLYVFAPKSLTYGRLTEAIGPALTTHRIVHVFAGR